MCVSTGAFHAFFSRNSTPPSTTVNIVASSGRCSNGPAFSCELHRAGRRTIDSSGDELELLALC